MEYLTYLNLAGVCVLGTWVIIHIKKSVTTWERFTKIEKRLSGLEEHMLDVWKTRLTNSDIKETPKN
jgi:hypothetical protein